MASPPKFHFDEDRAQAAVKFIKALRHTKGKWAGKLFQIIDWQEILLREIFGWIDDEGNRQYRTIYVEIPKKNGKTELGSAIALKTLCADGEMGAEVYSGAADREQASLIFMPAARMVYQNKALHRRLSVRESQKRIVDHETGSFYQALSTEAYTKHGLNIHAALIDELHAIRDREFVDVLTEGASDARSQPLRIFFTTAGIPLKESVCWEYHNYAEKVQDGIIDDARFLPFIFSAGPEENWEDEEVWKRVNPSIGHIIDLEKMQDQFRKAKEIPALENTFRRLRLNQWTSQVTRYIPMTDWDRCSGAINLTKGRTCFGGLDLSSTVDLTAFALVFVPVDGIFDVLCQFFMPEDNIRERVRKDKVPYDVWVRQGLITPTPGNVIDTDFIFKAIKDKATFYNLKDLAYDRWGATKLAIDLQNDGIPVFPMGQGFASMSPPTKELLTLTLQKRIRHGGHPILKWMASNVAVKQDPAGNVKPDKSKSTERIDGIVALIMALDRAIRHENQGLPEIFVWNSKA